MDIQHQFPSVHWIWEGGISFVYEVHPRIVVNVPRPCPSIVQRFTFQTDSGIFLEDMRGTPTISSEEPRLLTILIDKSLSSRIQNNHIRDQKTTAVTKVKELEPLPLRKEWMNDLAQAIAYLESLNLAHGNLWPENILHYHDRPKLSDFDCTAKLATNYEACMPEAHMAKYSIAT